MGGQDQFGYRRIGFFYSHRDAKRGRSQNCKFEFESFLRREAELGRDDLIFAILYIRVPALVIEDQRRQNDVLKIIHARQFADWTKIRQRDVTSFDVGQKIEEFCQDIVEALRKPWMSPEERCRNEEAEARQRADEERRRQQEEAARLAKEERQRRVEAEAERVEDERRRQDEEAKRIAEVERGRKTGSEAERQRLEREAGAKREAEERRGMAGLLNDIRTISGPSLRRWIVPPESQVASTEPQGRHDEAKRQAQFKERIEASTDRAELADLMKQNTAERPAIEARLSTLGYVPVATATAGEQWLKAAGGKEETERFRDCGANETWCPEMVVAPADKFTMGSPASEVGRFNDEGPPHTVTFALPFAVSKFAVTFDEWDACVNDRGCNGYRPDDNKWGRGRQPVINVSWDDAKAYVDWLSKKTGKPYRLLSEAEREYVMRAGTKTPFWWGSSISTSQANYDGNSTYGGGSKEEYRQRTILVNSFAANPWGLYQVHGNVWGWVEDCYQENYNGAPSDGSARSISNCASRVLRGGSWNSNPRSLRSADRGGIHPDDRVSLFGFRVARTL
jgi:formylglycine-generating enzyme required for sulfatase activity